MAAVGTAHKVTVSISNVNVNPFHMLSSRIKSHPRSSSPGQSPSASTSTTSNTEAQNKTFKRLRTSLEQSVRAATRSRAKSPALVAEADELGQSTVKGKEREKEKKGREGSKLRKGASRRESFEPPSLRVASASTPTLSVPSTPTAVPPTPKRRPTPTPVNINLNTPPSSPPPPETPTRPLTRRPSELRARSPSSPRRVTPVQGLRSTSASHLPLAPSPVPGRRSVDLPGPRRSMDSPGPSRAGSPTTPRRAQTSLAITRNPNSSTTSLSATPSPQREAIRAASSALCREMLKPGQLALGAREQEEVEVRMRPLARLERVWGKSGGVGMGSSSNLGVVSTPSAAGEERERRTFADALRDGYVLCQLMNKLRPGSIARVDAREDGRLRTSNVTKFLAAHAQHGLPSSDRFMRDDLIEATSDSLARVARTVSALITWAEAPAAPSVLRGAKGNGVYGAGGRAASSTPNLSGKSSPVSKARWPNTEHHPLPTVTDRADSPSSLSSDHTTRLSLSEQDDVPPIPPPRSPLRARVESSARASVMTTQTESSAVSENTAFSGLSLAEAARYGTMRTNTTADSSLPSEWPSLSKAEADSLAASLEDTLSLSTSSVAPSLQLSQQQPPSPLKPPLTPNRKRRPSETANVDLSRVLEEEGEATTRATNASGERAERIRLGKGKWPDDFMDLNSPPPPSQLAIPITPSKSGRGSPSMMMGSSPPRSPPILIKRPSHDAVLSSSPPRNSPPLSINPLSLSPTRASPRKVAVIGGSSPTSELAPPSPRRPTHRARHSVDAPGLLPKGRDSSPNASASPISTTPIMPINLRRDSSPGGEQPKVMLRRASTRHVSGGLLPKDAAAAARRGSPDSRADSGSEGTGERRSSGSGLSLSPLTSSTPGPVPFPRTSADPSADPAPLPTDQRPRGRFQSEVDGSSTRRKPRPNSFDEFAGKGAGARRSRFESMVNLGGASSSAQATASDLMGPTPTGGAGLGLGALGNGNGNGHGAGVGFGLEGGGRRNSAGSAAAVRQPLIVREPGHAATHFQLGNCIGRGQFGAVYRALNLNTGQMVAVKRISLEGLKEEEIRQLMKEVELVKSLRHPSIVKYEGMARDEGNLSIVLE